MSVTVLKYNRYYKGKLHVTRTFVALQKEDTWEFDKIISRGAGCLVINYYHNADYQECEEYDANDPRWLGQLISTSGDNKWLKILYERKE